MEGTEDLSFIQLLGAGMLLTFVLAFSIIFYILIYQRKLTQQKLHMQQLEMNHQKALLHGSIRTQEQERLAFAANLHDEIGALLSLAKMTLSSTTPERQEAVQQTLGLMDEIATSIRTISHNLHPPSLKQLGLEPALREFTQKLPETIHLTFKSKGDTKRFSEETELQIFRIAQEAINNAIKHADASEIQMDLTTTTQGFILQVNDNGKGFNVSENSQKGMGLYNMKSRAAMVGYQLQIESNSQGTGIKMEPLKK